MLFDTDVLIWALRGNGAAARKIDSSDMRAISIVSFMELLQGARSKREGRTITDSLRAMEFRVLPLSESIGATATALIERHALAHGIQVTDALVAATAIEAQEPLCSANAKHFRPVRQLTLDTFRPSGR